MTNKEKIIVELTRVLETTELCETKDLDLVIEMSLMHIEMKYNIDNVDPKEAAGDILRMLMIKTMLTTYSITDLASSISEQYQKYQVALELEDNDPEQARALLNVITSFNAICKIREAERERS